MTEQYRPEIDVEAVKAAMSEVMDSYLALEIYWQHAVAGLGSWSRALEALCRLATACEAAKPLVPKDAEGERDAEAVDAR
jgi:hypothetical protein